MGHLTANPLVDTSGDKTMVLNMGPQHPSTHGVLRLVLEIDGEIIVSHGARHRLPAHRDREDLRSQVLPAGGAAHRSHRLPLPHEQQSRAMCWRWRSCSGLEIPPKRAVAARALQRADCGSTRTWCGWARTPWTSARMSVFLYCFREREDVLRIFEMVSGQRMMTSYFRIGGVALEPPLGFFETFRSFAGALPCAHRRVRKPATGNPIWMDRTQGRGSSRRKMPSLWGVTGPPLRAAASTSTCAATCRTAATRSSSSRCRCRTIVMSGPATSAGCRRCASRSEDLSGRRWTECPKGPIKAEAPKVILPDREKMKTQMESLIYHFKIVTEGFAVPAGEVYQAIESPRGEMGYYVVSDGTAKPYRVHMRNAFFANLQALAEDVRRWPALRMWWPQSGALTLCSGEIDR